MRFAFRRKKIHFLYGVRIFDIDVDIEPPPEGWGISIFDVLYSYQP